MIVKSSLYFKNFSSDFQIFIFDFNDLLKGSIKDFLKESYNFNIKEKLSCGIKIFRLKELLHIIPMRQKRSKKLPILLNIRFLFC